MEGENEEKSQEGDNEEKGGDNEEKGENKEKAMDGREAPKLSRHYNSDDADISIISSDNVLLKVHSYRLMAASSVFRSMLSLPNSAAQRDPIFLTDGKIETSSVLKRLLNIVYKMDMSVIEYIRVYGVIGLAEKWDFEHVLELIRREISIFDRQTGKCFNHFQLSSRLQEPRIAASWLKRYLCTVWNHEDGSPREDFQSRIKYRDPFDEPALGLLDEGTVKGGRCFDVGTWAYGSVILTSPTVLWALLRATHVGTTTPAAIDSEKVAEEFERLLTLAYEPKTGGVD